MSIPIKDWYLGQDSKGEYYSRDEGTKVCSNMIQSNDYFNRRDKKMVNELKDSKSQVDEHINRLDKSIVKLIAKEETLLDSSKAVSRGVKDTAQNLANAIARIEKQADFNRLEKYVTLLERAESAMSSLAELEVSGKLDKIAGALK